MMLRHFCFIAAWLPALSAPQVWTAEMPDVTMSILAEWGWGGAQHWDGRVTVEGGTIVQAEGYLMDPGEKGVFGIAPGGFSIESFTAGLTDGARFSVRGPLTTAVVFEIGPKPMRIRLGDLLEREQGFVVSEAGCKIVVRRDPKDILRLVPECDNLVLVPGEKIPLRVIPNPITPDGKDVVANVALTIDGVFSRTLEHVVRQGIPAEWQIAVQAPDTEGVYTLSARARGRGLESSRTRLDFVVVDPDTPPNRPTTLQRQLVDQIDCTDPKDPHAYLGDPETSVTSLPLGRFRTTSCQGRPAGSRTNKHGHMGWFAYRLKLQNPGRCHIMEVVYPDDAWRTVGVSVFEPNAVGKLTPVQLDSGFHTGGEQRTTGKLSLYSLIFWPRTRNPIVLVTNRQEGADAAISKIRLYEVPAGLPALDIRSRAAGAQRLLGIYYEEPKVVENFGGPETRSGDKSIADWKTFYDAGRHLVDYMKYSGMNAVLMMSYGYQSTLYPTALARHGHRYDKWDLFLDGRDPFQKDLLELYCRLFERDGLVLVPSLDFEQLIPQLEAIREPDEHGLADIDMIRNDGANSAAFWKRGHGRNRLSPHYNPLHPAVQQAMVGIVSEVARRYAEYTSFAGIGIQHRALAFVQYPGLEYGYGDTTIRLFQQETGTKVPVKNDDPERFMKRYDWLLEHARSKWIDWRCRKLHELMLTLRDTLRKARPDLTLYVAYMNTFQSILVTDDVRDWVASGRPLPELFRVKGLDPTLYMGDDGIVVTRPVRQGPQSCYIRRDGPRRAPIARDLQLSEEVNYLYTHGPHSGVLVFHEYYESRLRDFDDVAWMPSTTWLVGTIPPAGRNNLERYASWMAGFDPGAIFDGGWQVPMGHEIEMREFAAEYRPLPLKHFATVPFNLEPVVCRRCTDAGSLYFYVINQAPYPVEVEVKLDPRSAVYSLSTGRVVGNNGAMAMPLPPFALRSFRADLPARILGGATVIPAIEQRRLAAGVRNLMAVREEWQKVLDTSSRTEILQTCGFKTNPVGKLPSGWHPHPRNAPWTVQDDPEYGRMLTIESDGERMYVNSPPFDPGEHQAIRISARLSGTRKTRARLFVAGNVDGTFWTKQTEVALTPRPRPVLLTVPELPTGQKRVFSVRVDIMGAGKLRLHGFTITPYTMPPRVVGRMIQTIDEAETALAEKHYARLERLLDSYWCKEALRKKHLF